MTRLLTGFPHKQRLMDKACPFCGVPPLMMSPVYMPLRQGPLVRPLVRIYCDNAVCQGKLAVMSADGQRALDKWDECTVSVEKRKEWMKKNLECAQA